jgi:hypothetical protein
VGIGYEEGQEWGGVSWVGMSKKLKTGADGEGMDRLKRGSVGFLEETEQVKNKC